MEIYLGAVRAKHGKLTVIGYAENVMDISEIVFRNNGKEISTEIKKSSLAEGRYCFEFSTELGEKNQIEFPENLLFQKFSTLSKERKAILSSDFKLWYEGNKIYSKKTSTFDKISVKLSISLYYLRTHQKVFINRLFARKSKEKIWLYCDRENLIDNGYYQFLHDIKKQDGVKRFYVTNERIRSEKFKEDERANVILFKSKEHKKLFFACEKVISSFSSVSIYSPFGSDPTAFYYDLLDYEFVYLQHGVLHANLPEMYAKEVSLVDRVVISSEFEYKNFQENYGYNADDLIRSGMARYDFADKAVKPKRKILFSPSWRGNLIGGYKNNTRELKPDVFLQSEFYKETQAFLSSSVLHKILEKNDLILDFKNHPIFAGYNDLFKIDSDRITVSSGDTVTDEYLVMITDYSSIVFDFVYLKRPIIYFVPDYDDFQNGISHGYSKLDLPLEDGFGKLTLNGDELTDTLKALIENGFVPEKMYSDRMESFFIHDDKSQRERLYKSLIND